jgi:hypoxanthine phosphoribosyltransferase
MAFSIDGLGEVLVEQAEIQAHVARLAAEISTDYADKRLHLIGVLKGAAVFLSDLMRALTIPVTVDFISIGPYGQATASGVVRIRKDLDESIEGKDVLVVEGVCASGLTLSYLLRNFQTRNPASLKVCTFLTKRRARPADVRLDYVGREIADVFAVGYGLDWEERYRNLPYIARLGWDPAVGRSGRLT